MKQPNPSLRTLAEVVALHYKVPLKELIGKSKTKQNSHARHVFCTLARTKTTKSLEVIARFLSNRDHTTIVYSAREGVKIADRNTLKELSELAIQKQKEKIEHIRKDIINAQNNYRTNDSVYANACQKRTTSK